MPRDCVTLWRRYTVRFDPLLLEWADFRGKVLGATDPSKAAPGSIRRALLDR